MSEPTLQELYSTDLTVYGAEIEKLFGKPRTLKDEIAEREAAEPQPEPQPTPQRAAPQRDPVLNAEFRALVVAARSRDLTDSETDRMLALADAMGVGHKLSPEAKSMCRVVKSELRKRDERIQTLETKLAGLEARISGLVSNARRGKEYFNEYPN